MSASKASSYIHPVENARTALTEQIVRGAKHFRFPKKATGKTHPLLKHSLMITTSARQIDVPMTQYLVLNVYHRLRRSSIAIRRPSHRCSVHLDTKE